MYVYLYLFLKSMESYVLCKESLETNVLCGPAVYFVLTHGDLQRREWTFCYSVV
jgi:hypothetical protein